MGIPKATSKYLADGDPMPIRYISSTLEMTGSNYPSTFNMNGTGRSGSPTTQPASCWARDVTFLTAG